MKLTVLRGVSGAGKTTRASQLLDDRTCIVAHDDIRACDSSLSDEQITEQVFRSAGDLLVTGLDVVIDACNLHDHDIKRWEAVAWAFGAELTVLHMGFKDHRRVIV